MTGKITTAGDLIRERLRRFMYKIGVIGEKMQYWVYSAGFSVFPVEGREQAAAVLSRAGRKSVCRDLYHRTDGRADRR
jgi:hypothetical protein